MLESVKIVPSILTACWRKRSPPGGYSWGKSQPGFLKAEDGVVSVEIPSPSLLIVFPLVICPRSFHHTFKPSPHSGRSVVSRHQSVSPSVHGLNFGLADWISSAAPHRLSPNQEARWDKIFALLKSSRFQRRKSDDTLKKKTSSTHLARIEPAFSSP